MIEITFIVKSKTQPNNNNNNNVGTPKIYLVFNMLCVRNNTKY